MRERDNVNTTGGVAVALLSTAILLFFSLRAPDVNADKTVCNGMVAPGTLDSVLVPPGASCTLMGGVIVKGDVKADGAVDVIIDGITIEGSVKIENSTGTIDIQNSRIDKSITLKNNRAQNIYVVNKNIIGGNVTAENNVTAEKNESLTDDTFMGDIFIGSCGLVGNTIDGNVTVKKNKAHDDIIVNCNDIDGNLTMADNAARDTIQVAGDVQFIDGNVSVSNNTAAGEIRIRSAQVSGNLNVKKNKVEGGVLLISGTFPRVRGTEPAIIDGNLTVTDNLIAEGGGDDFNQGFIGVGEFTFPDIVTLAGNSISGNLTVNKNKVAEGSMPIEGNTIDGNLDCKGNQPEPNASGNTVDGNENCNQQSTVKFTGSALSQYTHQGLPSEGDD